MQPIIDVGVGDTVGECVSPTCVGPDVDGTAVGPVVGDGEGTAVGISVGKALGTSVGDTVGRAVG